MDHLEIKDVPNSGQETSQEISIAINGNPIAEMFRTHDVPIAGEYARLPSRHLLDEPIEFYELDGRVAVLVCSECGDVGCGALFIRVTLLPDRVIWSEFTYANNYDPTMDDSKDGRFEFARDAYERELVGGRDLVA